MKQLLPRKHEFYDLFEKAANHAVAASALLVRMTEHFEQADPLARELDALEHACDEVAHTTMERLNSTFITPLDREDIHALILKIDDVVDLIDAAANRMAFFKVRKPTAHAVNMAKQIQRGSEKMASAVRNLRSARSYEAATRDCIAIHEVENAADNILHSALEELFASEKDPIEVIKWKDIYETMELATDRCEDVANVVQGVIVKMT